jgi:hypothetical protein
MDVRGRVRTPLARPAVGAFADEAEAAPPVRERLLQVSDGGRLEVEGAAATMARGPLVIPHIDRNAWRIPGAPTPPPPAPVPMPAPAPTPLKADDGPPAPLHAELVAPVPTAPPPPKQYGLYIPPGAVAASLSASSVASGPRGTAFGSPLPSTPAAGAGAAAVATVPLSADEEAMAALKAEAAAARLADEDGVGSGGADTAAGPPGTRVVPLMAQNVPPGLEAVRDEGERFRRDVELRPDEPSLDRYAEVPVHEFGAALLRGMGWAEGKAIGRNASGLSAPVEFVPRQHRLGLGAEPKAPELPTARRDGRKYIPKPGESTTPVPVMVAAPTPDGRTRHVRNVGEALIPLEQGVFVSVCLCVCVLAPTCALARRCVAVRWCLGAHRQYAHCDALRLLCAGMRWCLCVDSPKGKVSEWTVLC